VRRRGEGLDRIFLVTLGVLLGLGLVAVYSACHAEDPGLGSTLWVRQISFAAVGLTALLLCLLVPHPLWERLSPMLYFVALGLLVAVLVVGVRGGGATRWIALGGFRFQPSEPAKIAVILFLARFLADRRRPIDGVLGLIVPALIVLVPMALVLREPDMGTALVFLVVVPPMLYWSGVSFWYLLLVASPLISIICATSLPSWIVFTVGLLALTYFSRILLLERILWLSLSLLAGIVTPLLWGRLEPYQQQRILAFLDPTSYSTGAGYQIIQSKVAIGSGGLTGVGFLEGPQKGLAFLPARHTDFIFSVVGEEFGFVGTMTVLGLFLLLLVRGLRIAAAARDPFASLATVGILSVLAFQVFVNIGVTLGLVPVTGLPLPIFSYGGTSLISTLGALGIVLGVGLRRRV
jgi:rod shape determining protein RodA